MRTYFTIMIKENDTTNMKLLTEKLNEGFSLRDQISVGRSTVITLQKYEAEVTSGLSVAGLTSSAAYSILNTDVPF